MSLSLQMTGDWIRANTHLGRIATRLRPAFEMQFNDDGDFVLEKLRGHIDAQDLGWTPLKERTVELKGGDTTIYVETGQLKNGLVVKKVSSGDFSLFIGAPSGSGHSGGMSMSDLLIWLEYGTDKLPPRPLVQPTYDEVKSLLQNNWKSLFKEIVMEG